MPWRAALIFVALAAGLAALLAFDIGARLAITGPIEITEGAFVGVSIGDPQPETVDKLRRRFGQPTIIMPEPSREALIFPHETWIFYDSEPFAASITLEFHDERVLRIRAHHTASLSD